MRQRITYLQTAADAIDPSTLTVTSDSISASKLTAAREERVTFGFDELPQELYRVLKASHELHIRWVAERGYEAVGPLFARLNSGLHVFYTPQQGQGNSTLLCPMLKKAFGDIQCESPEESFSNLPRSRFSHSSASQYYTPLPSLQAFQTYLQHRLCSTSSPECLTRLSTLQNAVNLNIDYDTLSHALTITTFFPATTQALNLSKPPGSSRLEVGILSLEPHNAKEPEELSLAGFLTVIGEDTKPSPTLFSFPSRHHNTAQTFSSTFLPPTGLHPTLQLSISGSKPPVEDRSCKIHAYLTLPGEVFVDKYQFSDSLFLSSKNLTKLHYITTPVDLEAPAYTLSLWGSSVLLELAPPASSSVQWTAEIPTHLRYLLPNSNSSGIAKTEVSVPALFWACTAEEGSKYTVNPFDRSNLGYDGLFGPRTLFYHLSPNSSADGRLMNSLQVPVLDLDKSKYVEVGTGIAIIIGFGWVIWSLFGVLMGTGYNSTDEVKIRDNDDKKSRKEKKRK